MLVRWKIFLERDIEVVFLHFWNFGISLHLISLTFGIIFRECVETYSHRPIHHKSVKPKLAHITYNCSLRTQNELVLMVDMLNIQQCPCWESENCGIVHFHFLDKVPPNLFSWLLALSAIAPTIFVSTCEQHELSFKRELSAMEIDFEITWIFPRLNCRSSSPSELSWDKVIILILSREDWSAHW